VRELRQITSVPGSLGRSGVRLLDAHLRRSLGVFTWTEDPECILRLALTRARAGHTFADGTVIEAGDPLVEIHFWNERLPAMPGTGPDLRWARAMYRAFATSLCLLDGYLEATGNRDLAAAQALHAETGFLTSQALDGGATILQRLGFEVERPRRHTGAWARFGEFWADFYSWLLIWTYNPASLQHKRLLSLERSELWLSRRTLHERFPVA
jgi:hypothetical protein